MQGLSAGWCDTPPALSLSLSFSVASNLLPFFSSGPPNRHAEDQDDAAGSRALVFARRTVLQESKVAVQASPLPSLSLLPNCHLPNAAADPALLSRAGRRARPSRPSRVKHFQATHATALARPGSSRCQLSPPASTEILPSRSMLRDARPSASLASDNAVRRTLSRPYSQHSSPHTHGRRRSLG